MSGILVIADDLTGAAEIAGLGSEFGLSAVVATGPVTSDADLIVLDTNSRAMGAERAAGRVEEAMRGWVTGKFGLVYKKTDSVLRGQVGAELSAMVGVLGLRRALLVPQNPSKGRVIVGGEYLINGVPLDRTAFREDPEYPRRTARVVELCGEMRGGKVHVADVGAALADGITIGNAATEAEVRRWAEWGDSETILAGGADFFCAVLESRGLVRTTKAAVEGRFDRTLAVCGSAAEYSRTSVGEWEALGLPVVAMPDAENVLEERVAERWAAEANVFLSQSGLAILAIRGEILPQHAVAYRHRMAEAVRRLVSELEGNVSLRLIIEGGATAATIVGALGWDQFEIVGNMAPGVVMLRPAAAPHVTMIIKPGSYAWPERLFERS